MAFPRYRRHQCRPVDDTATFDVNETTPPAPSVIAGPPTVLILTNLEVPLLLYLSAGEPDKGVRVMPCYILIADNPGLRCRWST